MNTGTTYQEEVTQVTRKGQVTVPAAIRKALGIKKGDKVAFSLTDITKRQATIRPVRSVVEMTFGALASDAPMLSPQEEHEAFEQGAAEELAAEEMK